MKFSGLTTFIIALFGAFIGCGLFFFAVSSAGLTLPVELKASQVRSSLTPGMDRLDDFSCPKSQTKIIKILGVEDNFARAGDEPAIIRPRLLDFPLYADRYYGKSLISGIRNFDERGRDSFLMSFIEFPLKIDSGLIVTKVNYLPGSENDGFSIQDLAQRAENFHSPLGFGVPLRHANAKRKNSQDVELIVVSLDDIKGSRSGPYPSLLDYIKSQNSNLVMDIIVQDDTVVDFIGVALCQRPLERKGSTLAVDSRDLVGENALLLGCHYDPYQMMCDPHAGDSLCSTEVPLGCYREGNAPPMKTHQGAFQNNFVGGDINITEPVAGDQFNTLSEASDYCIKSFGSDWRVLSFHEGGGSAILAHGDLPPKTRMWVDVKDKPDANCWTNGPDAMGNREAEDIPELEAKLEVKSE